jgi:hypothetical protein
VVDRPRFLTWPHVERDGVLCLVPDHATFSVDDPYAGVAVLLDKAVNLIEGFVRGEHKDDFKAEFLTYWDRAKKGLERTVLSLVEPAPPSRLIRAWEGRRHIVLADNDEQLHRWLKNFNPSLSSSDMVSRGGVLVWLDTALIPSQYPKTAKDVHALAAGAGVADLLEELSRGASPSVRRARCID